MNDTEGKEIPGMFHGNLYGLLVRLSSPILIGMVVQLLYTIVDTFFISLIDKTDPSYIGGTGMIFPLLFFAISIAAGMMTGVGSVVAQAIGEKNQSSLNKAADSALAMGCALALLIMAGGFFLAKPLVKMLGAQGDYYKHGLTYFLYMLPFTGLMIMLHSVAGIFQGEGKMNRIMIAMLIGTSGNLILDPVFIFLLNLGVRGAALASVAGQLAAFIYVIAQLGAKDNTMTRIEWSLHNISMRLINKIAVIGFPMTLGQMAMALSIVFFNRILIKVDPLAMAAFTLVGRFDQGVLMPVFALSSAMITVVGQNAGRGNFPRIRRAWKSALCISGAVVLFLALVHVLTAPHLYRIFSDAPAVVDYCVRQTRILEFSLLFAVIGIIGRSVFQAVGYPLPALVLTIVRTLAIGFPLAYLFSLILDMKADGVYFGMFIGNLLTAVIGLFWISSVLSRLEKGTLRVASVGVV